MRYDWQRRRAFRNLGPHTAGAAMKLTWIVAPILLAALALGVTPAAAKTITARNTHDHGKGSLRAALAKADDGDRVKVPAGHYRLTTGELSVSASVSMNGGLSITGDGARSTVIDAGRRSRVLELSRNTTPVAIAGVTITGGRAPVGGGILNAGRLVLRHTVIRGNVAAGSDLNAGGAIQNSGTLDVLSSVLRDNRTARGDEGVGGALAIGIPNGATGPVTIERSQLVGNAAPTDGFGGAIAVQPTANAEDAPVTITQSTLAGNLAGDGPTFLGGAGGAIFFQPVDNRGASLPLLLRSDTFADNRAAGNGGAGGAIDFTPILNVAGGNAPITAVNSTFVGNQAGNEPGDGVGGAIRLRPIVNNSGAGAEQFFQNVTIARNRALGDGLGGGLSVEGLGTGVAFPTMSNSIVALNRTATGRDCAGVVLSGGFNIEGGVSCSPEPGPGDLHDTDPLLGPLPDNGGPTKTLALGRCSDARDHAPSTGCLRVDQRGVRRPQGGACDVGAFELKPR
jgi:hypothetical protein